MDVKLQTVGIQLGHIKIQEPFDLSKSMYISRDTMRATVNHYDPQAPDDRLTGLDSAGVEELNIKGRSLNRPFLERVVQVRVCDGR